ncbi:glycine cleavage T C-terminal barrel domain-containing protein [Planktotalea sp.]|uniref:glycine cleavage T C-terminal barrel domain-containing protein n=1 Tax=Planktotalea sp. TaxID=2029877 RepID=UPI003F6BB22B
MVGIQALRQIKAAGVKRQQLGIVLDDPERRPGHAIWYAVQQGERPVGHMTCGAWSRRAGSMIGFALVRADLTAGDEIDVVRGGYRDPATLCPLPFY